MKELIAAIDRYVDVECMHDSNSMAPVMAKLVKAFLRNIDF